MINRYNLIFASKVFLAAAFAIVIANLIGVSFPISAGIVAILSVAGTKRETHRTAIKRLIAFVVALLIAFICFTLMGFTTYSFIVYLLLFIFVCQLFKWNNAMAMNSVLISHFLSFEAMGVPEVFNEVLLFVIGVGIGVLVNITLRADEKSMSEITKETDEKIKTTLIRMGQRIMDPALPDYDGKCFDELRDLLRRATVLAKTNYNNQWMSNDTKDIDYISMREKQVDLLFVMYSRVSELTDVHVSSEEMSKFFIKVGTEFSKENTVDSLLEAYKNLASYMKEIPLPKERHEFEERARLYAIMRNMEAFLLTKKEYVNRL